MRKIISWLGMLSGLVLVVIMGLMCAEVFCRYVLNRPILGVVEISSYLLVLFVFSGMSYTQAVGGHIKIDLFTRNLSQERQRILRIISYGLALPVYALITRQTFIAFLESWEMGEVRWGALPLPIYPIKGVVAVGALFLCIQFVICLYDEFKHQPETLAETLEKDIQ